MTENFLHDQEADKVHGTPLKAIVIIMESW